MRKTVGGIAPMIALAFVAGAAHAADSIQVPLQVNQVAQFLSRPGVIKLPQPQLGIENPSSVLVKGQKDADGNCNWSFTMDFPVSQFSTTKMYSTVDTAWDPTKCEIIEERGWRTVPPVTALASPIPPENIVQSQVPVNGSSGEAAAPAANAAADPLRLPESFPCSGSSRPTTPHPDRVIGAYVEWTDGNHPVMRALNAEIVANWVRAELLFKNNFCNSPGYQLVGTGTFNFCSASGWIRDPDANNPIGYTGYACQYVCSPTCVATSGQAYHEIYGTFTNRTFPGCSPGVSTHYIPVKVVANNNGTISFPVNSTRTGVLAGCGEYLVQHRDFYQR
ncbi:hypothetical protein AAG565_07420 [Fontimonas sp. SYSU GA230001]|uniref:hypothetical protein n=1 Tax=Fontimonas sp. SYSU GA230001 TaxID=3142450 RepID=UPI0032B33BA1